MDNNLYNPKCFDGYLEHYNKNPFLGNNFYPPITEPKQAEIPMQPERDAQLEAICDLFTKASNGSASKKIIIDYFFNLLNVGVKQHKQNLNQEDKEEIRDLILAIAALFETHPIQTNARSKRN